MTIALLREELVEYSALQKLNEGLPTFGFTLSGEGQDIELREAFPTPEERQKELTLTTVAFGFNIDDGGKPAELGSALREYTHTLMVWTFAIEPRFGRKVAHAIKHVFTGGDCSVALLDFNQDENPQIDACMVLKAQVQHQVNNSPRPWDQYVWTTSVTVRDYFTP